MTFAFQGGEPTLAGLSFFQFFIEEAARRNASASAHIHYALQTNGILLDEVWCRFLREYGFLVGLSLDGPAEMHDLHRVDGEGKGTFKQVMEAKKLCNRTGVEYNVLMTLTNALARHPGQVWRFIRDNAIAYVQFTPCLAPLGSAAEYALTPERFARFYTQLFRLWAADWNAGWYTSVKFFDDVIRLLALGEVNACGLSGHCTPQLVVEADGSVYPCDFYMLDTYLAGDLRTSSMRAVLSSPVMTSFANDRPLLPALCRECPYRALCGGGCKRMGGAMYVSEKGHLCGYRSFLDDTMQELLAIAGQLRRGRPGE